MKIKVLYFAQCREATGKTEETVEVDSGSSAGDLKRRILKSACSLAGLEKQIALAVNGEIVSGDVQLQESDEVAFLLPPSGG